MSGGPNESFGWINGDVPIFARMMQPEAGTAHPDLGVVVVPGFGYVELVAREGWVVVANRLVAEGFPTILFDLPNTGSSCDIPVGTDGNPGPWVDSWITALGDTIRALGTRNVVLVGARLGALVASAAMHRSDIDAQVASLVLWSPTPSGRQFKRELTLLAGSAPGHVDGDGVTFGGFVHPSGLLNELGAHSLQPVDARGRQLLVIEDAQRPEPTKALSAFASLGWKIETVRSVETRAWLDASAELAVPPVNDVAALVDNVRRVAASLADDSPRVVPATGGVSAVGLCTTSVLNERSESVGAPRLAATVHQARGENVSSCGVLLLNSGVERAWGPGRAWVDAARKWAASGITVARVEHASTGDSGTWPSQRRNDVYGTRGPEDIALAVDLLISPGRGRAVSGGIGVEPEVEQPIKPGRGRAVSGGIGVEPEVEQPMRPGIDRVVAVGLCSSSFSLLQAGPHEKIATAIVINPQLFRIGTPPGVIEEATNHVRYWIARADHFIGLRRTTKALKRLAGRRHPAFDWIEAFVDSPTKLVLVFGTGDRGLRFLQREDPRQLAALQRAGVELMIIDGLDHALHSTQHRAQVMVSIDETVTRVCDREVAAGATS